MPAPSLNEFINRRVVLDTPGSIVYIGQLIAFDDHGYWLDDADVHDRDEGHSSKEKYVNDSYLLEQSGERTINRRRVFVERHAIISVSALDDVVADRSDEHFERWES